MDQTFERGIEQTIDRLSNMLNVQGRVDFVLHSWKPFSNLGHDGLQFKCVPAAFIPRMTLIPIVALPSTLGTHRVDDDTNRVKATEMKYLRESSFEVTDLISRFAAHSLVPVPGFNFNVTDIRRAFILYELVMGGVGEKANLEEYAGYLEVELPFTAPRYKGDTASMIVQRILEDRRLPETDTFSIDALLTALRTSVTISVEMATEAINGRLPQAIRQINEGSKHRFDETESWLVSQFPSFDTTSRITGGAKSDNQDDAITRLTDLLVGELSKKKVSSGIGEEEMNKNRREDLLPDELKTDFDTISDAEKHSRVENYLNKLNNMTIQPEDSVGMTASEMNRIDVMTNDEIVTKAGIILEEDVLAATLQGKAPEVSDFQRKQEDHTEGKVSQSLDKDRESDNTERSADPVNALREDLTTDLSGGAKVDAEATAEANLAAAKVRAEAARAESKPKPKAK